MANLWSAWKRLAHRAADVQGQVLFFVLYFLVLAPMGVLQRSVAAAGRRGQPERRSPLWQPREDAPADLAAARRQF